MENESAKSSRKLSRQLFWKKFLCGQRRCGREFRVCGVVTGDTISEARLAEPVTARDHAEEAYGAPVRPSLVSDDGMECRHSRFQLWSIHKREAFRYIQLLEKNLLAFTFTDKRQASLEDFLKQLIADTLHCYPIASLGFCSSLSLVRTFINANWGGLFLQFELTSFYCISSNPWKHSMTPLSA